MLKLSVFCAMCLSLLHVKSVHANDDVTAIVTHFTSEYGLHYVHSLNPKETIYSLSKFSGTSVKDIYAVNGLPSTSILSIGQELVIPVHPESVITDSELASRHKESLIKVMYRVKKKDNLFQIAKRHFSTDINTIVKRNKLSGLTISPDQILHIGWISLDRKLTVSLNDHSKPPYAQSSADPSQPSRQQVTQTHNQASSVRTNHQVEAPSVVTHDQAMAPSSTVSYAKTEDEYVSSVSPGQTATQVVTETVDNVNNHSASQTIMTDVKPKYRVVQHTPLHKKEDLASSSTTAVTTEHTPIKAEISSPAEEMPIVESTTSVMTTDATPVMATDATPVIVTDAQPNISSPATETVIAATEPSPTTDEGTIKSRDYPDLSFLSSPDLLTQRGIAMWDKNDNEPLNMFVLHHDAKIGSYIRVENPMLGRIVLAKVVARLPTNVYDADVKMVVSTAVANSLGVKDSRFLSEMKYIR